MYICLRQNKSPMCAHYVYYVEVGLRRRLDILEIQVGVYVCVCVCIGVWMYLGMYMCVRIYSVH
jgi:hypothetical protein